MPTPTAPRRRGYGKIGGHWVDLDEVLGPPDPQMDALHAWLDSPPGTPYPKEAPGGGAEPSSIVGQYWINPQDPSHRVARCSPHQGVERRRVPPGLCLSGVLGPAR
jgi:hypothetical protein